MSGRLAIGLYNTYNKKFVEAHRRALARAAPIALAFDCNLATFGFSYQKTLKTPVEIAEWVADSITIGDGGAYIIELAKKGRFSAFDFIGKGFPPQLGEIIITTRKPDSNKKIDAEDIAEMLRADTSFCLVFGLGPHGLEKKLFAVGKYHYDVTGKGLSLETCTAIGAVPSAIYSHLQKT